jgi:hypothetical protein
MSDNKKFLRNKVDSTIYEWSAVLAKNPKCEEVSEQIAFPENFQTKNQKGRKSKVDLGPELQEPDMTNPALAEEAAKGWPK